MRYGIKSRMDTDDDGRDRRHYVQLMLNEDADMALLRLLECFMEAAPQLTFQLFILCSYASDEDLIVRELTVLSKLDIKFWCNVYFQHTFSRTNWQTR